MRISPSKPIKLRQRLTQILRMLPPQIRLLHLPAPAPRPPLRRRTIHDRELVQHLVFGRDDEAARADDAVGGDADGVVDARAGGDCVVVADGGGFDAWDLWKGGRGGW